MKNSAVDFYKNKNYPTFRAKFLYFGIKLSVKKLYHPMQESFLFKIFGLIRWSIFELLYDIQEIWHFFKNQSPITLDTSQNWKKKVTRHYQFQPNFKISVQLDEAFLNSWTTYKNKELCRVQHDMTAMIDKCWHTSKVDTIICLTQ